LLRYHLWLAWLVGVPLLLWTVSGLVMVARPIETVRGSDLRIGPPKTAVALGVRPILSFLNPGGPEVAEYRVATRGGRQVAAVTYADGSRALFDTGNGAKLSPIGEAVARGVVRQQISSATVPNSAPQHDTITGATLFAAEDVPFDFRKPMPVWQVRLADGTHVYVGRDTAEIEAVRTRYWRFYDFMWGLHIMDLQTREDTHHPSLILFTAIAALASVLAILLLMARYAPRRGSKPRAE
jgi:hypothetical protein